MPSNSYIDPIVNRTHDDVEYARLHQADLANHNIGAWNYSDINRICNNLKYAAEHMYEQGFLSQPYSMQIKMDWKESDIITYEELNSMIVQNMNNLYSYSRPDLEWFPVASIANMDHNVANWLEKNIHQLAMQEPIPPEVYKLTIKNGFGSGEYEANTIVSIKADAPEIGTIFDHWSGDHLENIANATASNTTYKMPHQDITLEAHYIGTVPHTLTVETYSGTETVSLLMGELHYIEADPAPYGKVFHHWDVSPSSYDDQLYEPSATTHFTMPNEDVTLTAVYITTGKKYLSVTNGSGSGYYSYGQEIMVSPTSSGSFTGWSGDTQFLLSDPSQATNTVRMPDQNVSIRANVTITPSGPGGGGDDPDNPDNPDDPDTPPKTVKLTVKNGQIAPYTDVEEDIITEGIYTEGDRVSIVANPPEEGYVFRTWTRSGDGLISNLKSSNTIVTMREKDTNVTANFRELKYHKLEVTTASGTTTTTKEEEEYFSINANPVPEGQVFEEWTGDTFGLETKEESTSAKMGTSDRKITAKYREIKTHKLTVKQLSGDVVYEQEEFTTVTITAEAAPEATRFAGWSKSGEGKINSSTSQNITFTFGNGDAVLTPKYINQWTVTVVGGTIGGQQTITADEGADYEIQSRDLVIYEKFDGWGQEGPGTIHNTASTTTTFRVGNGNTTLNTNISNYPDRTLKVYWRDPGSNSDTLVFQQTYTHGDPVGEIIAQTAPNKSTFLTWMGDVALISPSALASTIKINRITSDVNIIATYFYPEAPQYFTLTVYDGYPDQGTYASGSEVSIRARSPNEGWEFYKWYGDTQYLTNQDLTLPENSVKMPLKAITLYAKFKVVGELPLYRVSVVNGTAKGTYITEREPIEEGGEVEQITHEEEGVYIDVPAGTEVTLTADPDMVGWVFDYWDGNFEDAGVTDIVKTNNPTTFTMVEHDVNVTMIRRELDEYTVYTTNATGPGTVYPGKYDIAGNLRDTDDYHYEFKGWSCKDADGNNAIYAIENPDLIETSITVTDKDLWIEAVYTTYYRLTVVGGQDSGTGYYAEGEIINTIVADTPTEDSKTQFDHWEDPMGVLKNKYDPTPTVTMKDTVATITAVFTSISAEGNSIVVTGDDIHKGSITRTNSYLVNGVYAIGAITFDKDGCIGVITETDPDKLDDTDDYAVQKLFYGGNF